MSKYEFEGEIREMPSRQEPQEAPKDSYAGLALAGAAFCVATGNIVGAIGCAYGAYVLSQPDGKQE